MLQLGLILTCLQNQHFYLFLFDELRLFHAQWPFSQSFLPSVQYITVPGSYIMALNGVLHDAYLTHAIMIRCKDKSI